MIDATREGLAGCFAFTTLLCFIGFSLRFNSDLKVMFGSCARSLPSLLFLLSFAFEALLIQLPARKNYHSNVPLNLDDRFELEVCSHVLKMRQVHV